MTRQSRLRGGKQQPKRGLVRWCGVVLVVLGVAFLLRDEIGGLWSKVVGMFPVEAHKTAAAVSVRGTIFDRNYKELAVSLTRVSVYARTREMGGVEETAEQLAPILGLEAHVLRAKLKEDSLRSWLLKNITKEQEEAVRKLNLPGIYLQSELSRYYPQEAVAGHLLGYAENDIGLAGVEYYYDRLIRSQLQKDPQNGQHRTTTPDILLSLDLKIQEVIEQVVKEIQAGRGDVRIGAYVMDPLNGAMLAAAQYPTVNPNTYRLYDQQALASILLQPMLLPKKFRKLFRDAGALQANYEARGDVLPWSIGAGTQSLGAEMRLWERLGISEERVPDFAVDESPSQRTRHYVPLASMDGPEFGTVPELMAPLQTMAALSILLNGGQIVEPFVVEKGVDPVTKEIRLIHRPGRGGSPAEAIAPVVSAELSQLFGRMARPGELESALLADQVQYEVIEGQRRELAQNQLLFAVLPVAKAEVAVLVTVQGAAHRMEGRDNAQIVDPAAVVNGIIQRLAVLQQVGKSVVDMAERSAEKKEYFPADRAKLRQEIVGEGKQVAEMAAPPKDMPNLIGMSLRKSLRLLQNVPCEIRVIGTGKVMRQAPGPGKGLAGVQQCVLTLQTSSDVSLEKLQTKESGKKQ